MHIMVIGAGIIGVTTAYFLAQAGHRVTVIERREAPGLETSYANGGQLSYTHVDPLASPGILPKLPGLLMGRDPAFRLKPSLDPQLLRWGLHFLRNCHLEADDTNTRHLLQLGLFSREALHDIVQKTGCQFDYRQDGKLLCFNDQQAFEAAISKVKKKQQWGSPQKILDKQATLDIEPSLASSHSLVGSIYSPIDESGDAHTFLQQLADYCASELSVQFLYEKTVTGFVQSDHKVTAIEAGNEVFNIDSVVIAAGIASTHLSRLLAISLPLYPLKGYSITVPATAKTPATSITDMQHKVVYCRLGDRLRIAGMAELVGYSETLPESRIQSLVEAAKAALPDAGDYQTILHRWTGLRPASPDSLPIIGASPKDNVFFNCGHGMLGWTLAAGSAALLAAVIDQKPTPIALEGFTFERFMR